MGVTASRGSCPACRAALWTHSSELVSQRRCPRCGAGLWVLGFSRGPVYLPRRPDEPLGGPALGAGECEALLDCADHLDVVELLWELEEGLRERGW